MKKNMKKLALHRETIDRLNLSIARGGDSDPVEQPTPKCPISVDSCAWSCGHTCYCI